MIPFNSHRHKQLLMCRYTSNVNICTINSIRNQCIIHAVYNQSQQSGAHVSWFQAVQGKIMQRAELSLLDSTTVSNRFLSYPPASIPFTLHPPRLLPFRLFDPSFKASFPLTCEFSLRLHLTHDCRIIHMKIFSESPQDNPRGNSEGSLPTKSTHSFQKRLNPNVPPLPPPFS